MTDHFPPPPGTTVADNGLTNTTAELRKVIGTPHEISTILGTIKLSSSALGLALGVPRNIEKVSEKLHDTTSKVSVCGRGVISVPSTV